ncbi:MAG: HU family DNA-binding protein [Bacteroidota bacterium]|nr:HU family DNA-binding protein [Bacteroidota bacterium]
MKQKDFIEEMTRQTGLSESNVLNLSEQTCSIITEILTDGDAMAIQGFGSFEVKKRDERISVNPSTGKKWLIPPKLIPVFKPGPTLKEKIKHLSI